MSKSLDNAKLAKAFRRSVWQEIIFKSTYSLVLLFSPLVIFTRLLLLSLPCRLSTPGMFTFTTSHHTRLHLFLLLRFLQALSFAIETGNVYSDREVHSKSSEISQALRLTYKSGKQNWRVSHRTIMWRSELILSIGVTVLFTVFNHVCNNSYIYSPSNFFWSYPADKEWQGERRKTDEVRRVPWHFLFRGDVASFWFSYFYYTFGQILCGWTRHTWWSCCACLPRTILFAVLQFVRLR